jgi:OOP family OmpA-OmpF porin
VREGQSESQSLAVTDSNSHDQRYEARTQFRNILFGTNSYNIESESYPQLNEIGKALLTITQTYPLAEFVIEGHTDSTGGADQNLRLSRYRADAIVNYLVQRFALDPRRIEIIGYGEQRPVASNDTDRGRTLNRRVEIVRR